MLLPALSTLLRGDGTRKGHFYTERKTPQLWALPQLSGFNRLLATIPHRCPLTLDSKGREVALCWTTCWAVHVRHNASLLCQCHLTPMGPIHVCQVCLACAQRTFHIMTRWLWALSKQKQARRDSFLPFPSEESRSPT